jgi:tetratricopeptide (TPR) repeat protein
MAKKFIFALITMSAVGAFALDSAPAKADGSLAVFGARPTDQCADAAAAARRTGTATKGQIDLCNQAVTWAKFQPLDYWPALLNRGVLHLVRAEYGAAIVDINYAIKQGAELSDALNDRGAAEAGLRHYQAAADDFTQALAAGVSRPEVTYFNRALIYEDLGDMKRAYLDYKKAAELNPHWDAPAKELARFTVARATVTQ